MSLDSRLFRQACGQFATGVTVVAVQVGDTVHGMTANSFTSVSLDPPLVLVCIDLRNQTHALIEKVRAFSISVLHEDQEAISNWFAGRRDQPVQYTFHSPGTQTPVLEGAIAWIDCTLHAAYDGGDHTIYVGRVQALACIGGRPLLFYGGRYTRLPEAV